MRMERERNEVVRYGQKLIAARLTTGTGGNVSCLNREEGLVAISPSGMDYMDTRPEDVVLVTLDGDLAEGDRVPSSEAPLHLAHYRKRPEIGAVVHTHSVYATTIATLRWEIPAMHYLVGFSGDKVPCAPYATYGSEELARVTSEAIGGYNAVLMANHGMLAVGANLASAFTTAEIVELLAQVYYQAKCIGTPQMLGSHQMSEVLVKFETYGQQK